MTTAGIPARGELAWHLDQLIGAMQNVQVSHGLLVSWGGFKSSVDKEEAIRFFRVRLWDQDDLIDQVLRSYDKLDEEIRAEIPLKHIFSNTSPMTKKHLVAAAHA